MALYPNPNSGEQLFVNLAGIDRQQVALDVMASNGQRVRSFTLNVENNTINTVVDLQGLASGVYLVQVQTGSGVITERLVVQH